MKRISSLQVTESARSSLSFLIVMFESEDTNVNRIIS